MEIEVQTGRSSSRFALNFLWKVGDEILEGYFVKEQEQAGQEEGPSHLDYKLTKLTTAVYSGREPQASDPEVSNSGLKPPKMVFLA